MRGWFRTVRLWTFIALASLLACLAVVTSDRSARAQTPTPTTLNVGAGVSDMTADGQVFAPGDFTVLVGGSVRWTINSDEPHSLTFGQGPSGTPPPSWPVAGFTAPPPGPPGAVDLGSVDYSGTEFINTGLLFQGSTATIRFTTAGAYPFICVIHPGMRGTVHVINSGSPTSQAQADQKAQATSSFILDSTKIANLRQRTAAAMTSEVQANSTTKWTIAAGAKTDPESLPGGGTGFLDLMEFNPQTLNIKADDTVVWKAPDPHTVTFLASGQTSSALESQYGGDPTAVPLIRASENYDGTSLYTSGLLASGAPGAPDTFSLTFPTAGTFPYICLLHEEMGMRGTIVVGASTTLPKTGSGATSSGSRDTRMWWLAASLAAGWLALGGLAVGARRLRR